MGTSYLQIRRKSQRGKAPGFMWDFEHKVLRERNNSLGVVLANV